MIQALTLTALPGEVPLHVYQGDTFARSIDILEGDLGTPVDLTDSQCVMVVRKPTNGVEVAMLNNSSGITYPSPGKIVFRFEASATAEFPTCELIYDFKWTRADGTVKTLFKGKMIVQADI